jgi:hypothetical protein
MNEKVLKNESDFLKWKQAYFSWRDVAEPPERYPCLAITTVKDMEYSEMQAEYLYREDIVALLGEMDA